MHVLIATDGSPQAIDAARAASELLRTADEVTLLAVILAMPNPAEVQFADSVYDPEVQAHLWSTEFAPAAEAVEALAPTLTRGRIDKRIEVGKPEQTICDVAREVGADVIVVGSHGRTGLGRLLIGSVSEHVVRHAPCPVLVVRH